MPHAIWKGDISFGLVSIPVNLFTAESHKCDVKLVLLDKRDLSPVGYQKINKNSGEKVPPNQLVSGYEYEDNSYVILSKEEIKKVHPPSNQSIDIQEFVNAEDIQPEFYERPYYLEPLERGMKGYALLRDILERTKKVAIAKVVIRTRQYLAALVAENKALVLELLRFPCELISQTEFKLPDKNFPLKKNEIQIAEELVKSMTGKWTPAKYANEYQGSLLDYIMGKIKLGESYSAKDQKVKPKGRGAKGQVIDIMHLLKKSVAQAKQMGKARSKNTKVTKQTKVRKLK